MDLDNFALSITTCDAQKVSETSLHEISKKWKFVWLKVDVLSE